MRNNLLGATERDGAVDQSIIPTPHPDPWVNRIHSYAVSAVCTLDRAGLRIHQSWLDPSRPRDMTILFTGGPRPATTADMQALVWDEETGWCQGLFEAGRPGVRTTLRGRIHVGGGLVPQPSELSGRVLAGASAPARCYRSSANWRDGIDDQLWREADLAELVELV